MRSFKQLSVFIVALLALCAIGATNASASTFTASATGSITGKALETQKFKTNGGTVECPEVHISGTIPATQTTDSHETWEYTSCTAFGFPADASKTTYTFTSDGSTHYKTTLSFTVTGGIFGECTVTVPLQTAKSVTYTNNSGKIKITPNITGIKYTSSGGICGSSGENGTYTGASEIERVGGGTISWDA